MGVLLAVYVQIRMDRNWNKSRSRAEAPLDKLHLLLLVWFIKSELWQQISC